MIGEIRIAGPCAAESRSQMIETAQGLKNIGIEIVRGCWWKPRTVPGWEGVGKKAAPWASEITNMGMTIATEVLLPEHVIKVINGIEETGGDPSKVLMWLGSRNQNHMVQRAIARAVKNHAPDNVQLLIKNQPWPDAKNPDKSHWLGIVKHLEKAGFPKDRMILGFRGFALGDMIANPRGLRNIPDIPEWEIVELMKKWTGLPMLIDPSHIGGTVENVIGITLEASKTGLFDGFLIEAHPNPAIAKTDAKQQLSIRQLESLLTLI